MAPVAEWRIEADGYVAEVTAVGATLRSLTFQGRDLVVPFGSGEVRPRYRGALVAPWPNRVVDGRYEFGGNEYQLPLNEVDRRHALHGLVCWERFELVEATADRLVLEHWLVPQDGYPFPLHLVVEFRVGREGLRTELTATNVGATAVPYGCCPHPYLVAGPNPLDSWELTAPGAQRLEVDDRLSPLALAAVADVDCDFRRPAVIGDRAIDHAFTAFPVAGRHAVRVLDPAAGTGVELSWGPWGSWLQLHTADRPEPEHHRIGLAVEPMSCPPNAFNLGADTPVLAAGATHRAEWTITAV